MQPKSPLPAAAVDSLMSGLEVDFIMLTARSHLRLSRASPMTV
jgi:hypothetical protein